MVELHSKLKVNEECRMSVDWLVERVSNSKTDE